MSRFVSIAKTSEIPPGERAFYEVEGIYIAVFNVGGTYYAIEDACTHDDGPLAEGDLHGFELECPRHGARFDIRTGDALSMPAVTPTGVFPVKVDGDDILIELPD
ncbi:MAG: non-heme iron oxygenase ferredoxin subunit [Anaerolineae bacterium]|nr:non-heme iron oxygenase ferredoxin subunit [Anaerolineae bacterium]